MELVEVVDENYLVKTKKLRPYVCSPNTELAADVVVDLDTTSSVSIPWEIRLKNYVPKVVVELVKITRKYDNGGKDYRDQFLFHEKKVFPEAGDPSKKSKEQVISAGSFYLAVKGHIKAGIYFLHFKGTYESEKMSGQFEFDQKLQLLKPSLRRK